MTRRERWFQSVAQERYLLAVPRDSPLALKTEIDIEDLRAEKISIASNLPADFLLSEIQQSSAE